MKLGLGSYAFRWSIGIKDLQPVRPMTAMEVLEIAHAHGLSVVQYADNLPLDRLTPAQQLALRERAHSYGMALELGTQSFDVEELGRYIPIGERIGSGILRVALDAADAQIPVHELAAQIREILPDGKRSGLRFAIENHFNYPSPRMVELLEAVADESLGVCLDVANSICAGEWPMTTIRMLAPYTINLHLKDYRITPRSLWRRLPYPWHAAWRGPGGDRGNPRVPVALPGRHELHSRALAAADGGHGGNPQAGARVARPDRCGCQATDTR
nr:TIM barrel protein [Sinorhizobium meliloti]